MRVIVLIGLVMAVQFTGTVSAAEGRSLGLTNYEPNLIGYTYDGDDKEPFLDFKLSLAYPLAHGPISKLTATSFYPGFLRKVCSNDWSSSCYPHFSFTGRFGQYIKQRDSSPVIAKRFNPKLFLRFDIIDGDYLDLEYAHESNGQRVTTQASYDSLASELASHPMGKREHANDHISRGWDYWGITYKHTFRPAGDDGNKVTGYLNVRKFVGGALQGEIEEYFDWESRREITSREEVGGIWMLAKVENKVDPLFLAINKVALLYETGFESPGKYNTVTLEFTTHSLGVPLMLWGRSGYNSDLAQYYKKVDSFGLAFELKT